MTSAAIYARVSSDRRRKDETIASRTAALREHAGQRGLEVPAEWVFEDEGHSGATLVRPALERNDCVASWPASGWTWCCAIPRTGWPVSSPTRPC
jgi:hypothetical protein